MKRLILGCAIFILGMFLAACGRNVRDEASGPASGKIGTGYEPGTPDEKAGKNADGSIDKDNENNEDEELIMDMNKSYTADSNTVKQLGRTYLSENGVLWCAFSGTGAEFKFTGRKCTVNIVGDTVSITRNFDNHARLAIYVNGERVVDDMVSRWKSEYVVVDESEPVEAVVRIVKLSECAMSTFGIASIDVEEGKIEPTKDKDLFIEFIGDSITCGYGVDDEDKDHHFSTKTEDVTRAYAYKTAEALDADYSMVSISGYGIISGYTNDDNPVPEQIIPPYYDTLGFSYGGFADIKPQDIKWDFTKRQPDLIVINLGTNDSSYTKGNADRQEVFAREYTGFIKKVRGYNPDAAILCSLGIMGDELYPAVKRAVDNYTAETGDTNIYTLKFDVQNERDGYVADWHPTEKTHTKAAEKLVEKIREILDNKN